MLPAISRGSRGTPRATCRQLQRALLAVCQDRHRQDSPSFPWITVDCVQHVSGPRTTLDVKVTALEFERGATPCVQ